jgi:hypothetical protein
MLSTDFYGAIYAFFTTVLVATAIDYSSPPASNLVSPNRLVFTWRAAHTGRGVVGLWILSALLLTLCAMLNWIWR